MNIKELLSKETVNPGRQKEIDLIKAFSIIMMIITHCIEELFVYEGHLPSVIIVDVLNRTIGASAFMICMGIGIVYAKSKAPKTYLQRGLSLLIVGQVLNLFRYALPYGIDYLVTGEETSRKLAFLVFSSDIMQFAGLTFLVLALLTYLHLSELMIFIVSVVLNVSGMLLSLRVDTGIYALDQLTGLFVFTTSESYFPFFNWFIYPAFGILFGSILKRVNDKKRFYLFLLIPTGILTAIYYVVALFFDQPFLVSLKDAKNFSCVGIFDAVMQLFIVTFLISLAFFVTAVMPEKAEKAVRFVSGNINRFYCVQWTVIVSIAVIISFVSERSSAISAGACYGLALFVIAVTWILVLVYAKYLAEGVSRFISKRKYLWYVLAVMICIVVCRWAYTGQPMPNLFNDYLE